MLNHLKLCSYMSAKILSETGIGKVGHLLRMEDNCWRFTSGHRTVRGEEEDRKNHGGAK